MKVTVCELADQEHDFKKDWEELIAHTRLYKPDLILLPEMPFCKWVASEKIRDRDSMLGSVEKHEWWLKRLDELHASYIIYSRPVLINHQYFNSAFVYERAKGHKKLHTKYYFPEEDHFWEQTWYSRENKSFEVLTVGDTKIGVLLCTEMWFGEYARQYGKQGADLLLCPRATGMASVEQWLRCGQGLAVVSGAFCLSSNKTGKGDNDFHWGGRGWIAAPGDGALLAVTGTTKFQTVSIDISKARAAKSDYPLYVKD